MAADGSERCTQLMADHRNEFVLHLIDFLPFGDIGPYTQETHDTVILVADRGHREQHWEATAIFADVGPDILICESQTGLGYEDFKPGFNGITQLPLIAMKSEAQAIIPR